MVPPGQDMTAYVRWNLRGLVVLEAELTGVKSLCSSSRQLWAVILSAVQGSFLPQHPHVSSRFSALLHRSSNFYLSCKISFRFASFSLQFSTHRYVRFLTCIYPVPIYSGFRLASFSMPSSVASDDVVVDNVGNISLHSVTTSLTSAIGQSHYRHRSHSSTWH